MALPPLGVPPSYSGRRGPGARPGR